MLIISKVWNLCCGFSYKHLNEDEHTLEECPICLEETQLKSLHKCKHKFCNSCIVQWCSITDKKKIPKCPLCREQINLKKNYPNYSTINS